MCIRDRTEIGGMAEGQHPGEPQKKIHRHGRKSEDENAGSQRGVATQRRHPVGNQQQHRPDASERDQFARVVLIAHVIMPSSPSNPRGRISRTTAISTYMMASLAAGKTTGVMPDPTPISRPPSSVPVRLPTPPTMMAMKLGIRSPAPMVGSRPSWPAASTPLSPARKMPAAKLSDRNVRTLTPNADTVSRSSVPARMRMPRRV